MNRKTLLAGAVFAGLLVITMLVLREPEKGTRTGESPRPVAAIGEGNLDTLEITEVDAEPAGDVSFPAIGADWREMTRDGHDGFSFITFRRLYG